MLPYTKCYPLLRNGYSKVVPLVTLLRYQFQVFTGGVINGGVTFFLECLAFVFFAIDFYG